MSTVLACQDMNYELLVFHRNLTFLLQVGKEINLKMSFLHRQMLEQRLSLTVWHFLDYFLSVLVNKGKFRKRHWQCFER